MTLKNCALKKVNPKFYSQLLDAVNQAVIATDLEGIVIYWNQFAEQLYGWKSDEVLGHPIFEFNTPLPFREQAEQIMALLRAGKNWEGDFLVQRKDNSQFWAHVLNSAMFDEQHNLFAIVGFSTDISKRKQMEEDLRYKEEQRKLIQVQEMERKRIARNLHDELGQQLTALRLKLSALKNGCNEEKLLSLIDETQGVAQKIDDGIDFLAWELRPAALADHSLFSAINEYVYEWSNYSGIEAECHSFSLENMRLHPEVEINLYRIVQEALNNVAKHANATRVEIVFEKTHDSIILVIEDNGKGFVPKEKIKSNNGFGLTGIRERATIIDGTCDIESSPNNGTTIFVRVPFELSKLKSNDNEIIKNEV